ncbi:MAG: MotA/TolQ/ExbB proton channel family protein [Candidatus Omnitrophica bacterium]|jgi:biopolymer transport protein ExbB|nr:MotA/TolQ/ExbB proton channel family protein [Candidatus Omnitrophota bacterium]
MWNFIIKGGPVMLPIILGSVYGLAIILEKVLFLKRIKIDSSRFVQDIFKYIKGNNFSKALELCDKNIDYPIAAVFKIGIERRNSPAERLEKVLEQAGNNQVQRMEKRLGALASIVGIEPLLGFLGTITGLIRAFMSWEQAGANITVNALAMGIYQAMITTAAGLMVAIPFYLCYNYFISRIKYAAAELNNYAIQLIEVVSETREAVKS